VSAQANPFLQQQDVEEALKLRLALSGTSGSGKTYSALSIATALGGPIAVIDTERKSSRRYKRPRGPFDFMAVDLDGDYHPRRYIDLMRAAADAGAQVLIVDSLSHAWEGRNGILDLVDQAGGRLQDWKKVKPFERELLDAMLDFPGHIIVTLRTKSAYEDVEDRNGKTSKKKVGLQAVQREGIEYEFDVVLRMQEARAHVEKSRCSALFDAGALDRPGENLIKILRPWLEAGVRPADPPKPPTEAAQINDLINLLADPAKKAAAKVALLKAGDHAALLKIRARVETLLAEQAKGNPKPAAPPGRADAQPSPAGPAQESRAQDDGTDDVPVEE
jgi:hypothetical protein